MNHIVNISNANYICCMIVLWNSSSNTLKFFNVFHYGDKSCHFKCEQSIKHSAKFAALNFTARMILFDSAEISFNSAVA